MTAFYVDTDDAAGSDSGADWTNACTGILQVEALGTPPGFGDVVYIQGAATDTIAGAITHSFNDYTLIGCVDGTTNVEASMVEADFADRTNAPTIAVTGVNSDINFVAGMYIQGVSFDSSDRMTIPVKLVALECIIKVVDRFTSPGMSARRCKFDEAGSLGLGALMELIECEFTAAAGYLFHNSSGTNTVIASDLSGRPNIASQSNGANLQCFGCKLHATYSLFSATVTALTGSVELIGCQAGAVSKADGDSVQNYEYESYYGTITNSAETRTGGADDGASGGFSIAIAPNANTEDGNLSRSLQTNWNDTWLSGGASQTLTVFITNATGNLDINHVSLELVTANSDDSTQHVYTVEPTYDERIIPSTTALAVDTSVWSVASDFPQKLAVTLTTGYTGWARWRLTYMKTSGAVLYLDPKLVVT